MLEMLQLRTVRQVCPLCKQDMNDCDGMEMVLNEAELYAVCPHCRRGVEKKKTCPKWCKKVDKYFEKQRRQEKCQY